MASNIRFLEGELVYQKRGMLPICANIASQQFRFTYDRLKGACIFIHVNFFSKLSTFETAERTEWPR